MPLNLSLGLDLATGGAPSWRPRALNPLAWYDVALSTPGQTIPDQMGGPAATLGSGSGSDANDPAWAAGTITFDGSNDYVQIPAAAVPSMASGASFTVVIAGRQPTTINDFGRWASFRDTANNGPDMLISASGPLLFAEWGAVTPNSALTTGVRHVAVMSSDGTNLTVQVDNDTSATLGLGAEARPGTPNAKLGAYQDGGQAFQQFDLFALLTFTRQLSSPEIAQLAGYYAAGI